MHGGGWKEDYEDGGKAKGKSQHSQPDGRATFLGEGNCAKSRLGETRKCEPDDPGRGPLREDTSGHQRGYERDQGGDHRGGEVSEAREDVVDIGDMDLIVGLTVDGGVGEPSSRGAGMPLIVEECLDTKSVASTSAGPSANTARRRLGRDNQKARDREEIASLKEKIEKLEIEKKMESDKVSALKREQAAQRLRNLVVLGKIQEQRRQMNMDSSDEGDNVFVVGNDSISSASYPGTDENEGVEEGSDADSETISNLQTPETSRAIDGKRHGQTGLEECKGIHGLGLGDFAEIFGLVSEKGQELNSKFGRLESWDNKKKRFSIRVGGHSYSMKPENLRAGFLAEGLNEGDEEVISDLRATPEEVRALPWKDRMTRLGWIQEDLARVNPSQKP